MLEYLALAILFFVVLVIFYGVIIIHDIPYEIAKKRKHPHQDSIHVAGWISLFTLHLIWPFLWIWATLYRTDRGWGFNKYMDDKNLINESLKELQARVDCLEKKIKDK